VCEQVRAVSLKKSLRLRGRDNAGESGASAHAAVVPFVDRGEASLHSVTLLEAPMCTKIPYANRWLAAQAVKKLHASGRGERAIHPCFTDHPGYWHVTSKKTKTW
jgi:hypothetical protein